MTKRILRGQELVAGQLPPLPRLLGPFWVRGGERHGPLQRNMYKNHGKMKGSSCIGMRCHGPVQRNWTTTPRKLWASECIGIRCHGSFQRNCAKAIGKWRVSSCIGIRCHGPLQGKVYKNQECIGVRYHEPLQRRNMYKNHWKMQGFIEYRDWLDARPVATKNVQKPLENEGFNCV